MDRLTLNETQAAMTQAIKRVEQVIDNENDARAINAANCLSGLVSRYTTLLELEHKVKAQQPGPTNFKAVKNF